jgi:hypothetical protein
MDQRMNGILFIEEWRRMKVDVAMPIRNGDLRGIN